MKNKISISIILISTIIISLVTYMVLTFENKNNQVHEFYQVYLGGQSLGLISSEEKLYEMIDQEQKEIKEKYNVDKVYPPSTLIVQKVNTYKNDLKTIKEIYEEIKDLDPFTIEGYQVSVKNKDGSNEKNIYILNKEDLDVAIENTVYAFLDEQEYEKYLLGIKKDKNEEGMEITDIYFEQDVALKKMYISTEENIITNDAELSQYFLFGTLTLSEKYKVSENDTIESIAYDNQLGVSDFLIANPNIVNENALLAIGQEVTVAAINPVANVVVESYETEVLDVPFETKIEYDKNMDASKYYVKQQGITGSSKVTYITKTMNGVLLQTAMVNEEVITPPVDKIIVYGGHNITYVGNSTYWAWPTSKPYRISSHFGYRIHPIYHESRFHDGTDITGTRSDNIYSIQSGKVIAVSYNSSMGNYVKIDHQNGYVSLYLHLKKQLVSVGDKVEKGELIGIMGNTGASTGKHLHLTVIKNGNKINPLTLYQ